MKCIQLSDNTIKRVTDEEAKALVKSARAIYVPKSLWKKQVRDVTP